MPSAGSAPRARPHPTSQKVMAQRHGQPRGDMALAKSPSPALSQAPSGTGWLLQGLPGAVSSAWRREGGLQESWRGAVTRAWSDRTRGDGFKLEEGRFRLDPRK